jgi:hypothetical protein
MRSPKEILKNIVSNDKWVYYDGSMYDGDAGSIYEAIKEAQEEAYNEAIDDAIKHAKTKVIVYRKIEGAEFRAVVVDEESLLKLKK